jgi:hypothetical protein
MIRKFNVEILLEQFMENISDFQLNRKKENLGKSFKPDD